MRRLPLKCLLLSLCLCLAGCATPPPELGAYFQPSPTQPKQGAARLTLYRAPRSGARLQWPTISINKQKAFELVDGAYTRISLPPGNYIISTSWPKLKPVAFQAIAGQDYFIGMSALVISNTEVLPTANGGMMLNTYDSLTDIRLRLVNKDTAIPSLSQCRYLAPLAAFAAATK